VARVDWPRFRAAYEADRPRPFFGEMPGPEISREPSLISALGTLGAEAKRARVLAWMRATVAELLEIELDRLQVAPGFFDVGFDSVMGAELRSRAEAAFGVRLRSTAVFDHPSVEALSDHLLALLDPSVETRSTVTATAGARYDEPIAVIGMGCRLPGGIDAPE